MIVGVDAGSQSLKAVVLDDRFQVRGTGRRSYVVSHPRPGWAEQETALWEQALAPAIAEALAAARCNPADVSALGIAGQLDGAVAIDANTRPLGPCILWMDRRADSVLPKVATRLPATEFRRRTGSNLDGTHMGPKIRWSLDHRPETRGGACFHQPVSYLVERLTGVRVMDHGQASTTLLYDLAAGAYADDLLGAFDLPPELLPPLARAETMAGRLTGAGAALTGLPAGVPVAVGTGDDFSTPLGAGIVAPGIVANVLGTAEVVGALDPRPIIDDANLVETHRFVGSALHYIENPGWVSGGALEWLRALLGIADFQAFDRLAEGVPPGSDGLLFLPALTGAMTPEWIAGARGCFYGLTPSHGAGHLARAALEGTAFGLRDVIEALRRMGVGIDRIRALGGGSKSLLWTQIRADVTGLPVERARHADTSAIGAALLAAVAAGKARDLSEAAGQCATVSETLAPAPCPAYDDAHGRYRRLFASLKPMYRA